MSADESLRQQTYFAIRERIVNGSFRAGDPLSDSRIAADLGVSRTPVRAALEALEADGLVRRHRTGHSVAVITPQTIHDVFFVRIALECHSLRSLNLDDPQSRWDKFEQMFSTFQSLGDQPIGEDWLVVQEADILFHREIVLRTGNEVALEIADRVERRIFRLRALASKAIQKAPFGARDHLPIVGAILAGDLERAAGLLEGHLTTSRDFLLSLMSRSDSPVTASPATGFGPLALWLEGEGEFPPLKSLAANPPRDGGDTGKAAKAQTDKFRPGVDV
jgi:DNA-binding GntR family transcriptional regulator